MAPSIPLPFPEETDLLRDLLDSVPDALVIHHPDSGALVYANRAYEELTGLRVTADPVPLEALARYRPFDAARALGVHANTVDNRLDRIAELTGVDPRSSRGIQLLGAALVVQRTRG